MGSFKRQRDQGDRDIAAVQHCCDPFFGEVSIVMRDDDPGAGVGANLLGGDRVQGMRNLVEVIPGEKGKCECGTAHLGSPKFATMQTKAAITVPVIKTRMPAMVAGLVTGMKIAVFAT